MPRCGANVAKDKILIGGGEERVGWRRQTGNDDRNYHEYT